MAYQLPVKMHKKSYPAIDPSRPELSQRGRTILVTGGGTGGIGFSIATSFAQANAATIVLVGRRSEKLKAALAQLETEFPDTKVIAKVVDMTDDDASKSLWAQLEADGVVVDVLVLNAAKLQLEKASLLEYGHENVMNDLRTNVGANLMYTEYFYRQKKRAPGQRLFLISVSTMSIHDFNVNPETHSYALSKNAGTLLLQLVAKDVAANDMQVVSFHPGYIATDMAREMGYTDPTLPWDHDVCAENLPGHYAVWAASDEAAFLHGRFTWTAWDVDDLRTGEARRRIDEDNKYLKIGVGGL
ncbi:hypothetical protein S40288_09774 [Stachybotrys chartarum IBT 40288]|nr:hypothetical protein S40288_09774 [Stachybotrys chartarum IBT 40288]